MLMNTTPCTVPNFNMQASVGKKEKAHVNVNPVISWMLKFIYHPLIYMLEERLFTLELQVPSFSCSS